MTMHEFGCVSLLNRLNPCVDLNKKRTIHKFDELGLCIINDGTRVQFQPIVQKRSL